MVINHLLVDSHIDIILITLCLLRWLVTTQSLAVNVTVTTVSSYELRFVFSIFEWI